MQTPNADTVFPCPLSPGYGIPARQAWLVLKVFLAYRLVLAVLLFTMLKVPSTPTLIEPDGRHLYLLSSEFYFGLSLLSAACVLGRVSSYSLHAQTLVISDIVILTLIMHACGGPASGMGILLAVSIAAGGLLIGGRCAMATAALGCLAVASEQIYAAAALGPAPLNWASATLLGASFLGIASLSYALAKRSEQILQLANRQQQTIANLEEISRYIIQHMQSGIILVDRMRVLQMANEAALRLLNLSVLPSRLADISPQLGAAFDAWLINAEHNFTLLKIADQAEIQIRFAIIPTQHDFFYMIIIEDIGLYSQRLQQGKLASLGQLTASIAHEIRNPLSAISHAGQLLSENAHFSAQDKRLTDIIQTHCQRVNGIIEDILRLSRRADSSRQKLRLFAWLKNYLYQFALEYSVGIDAFRLVQKSDSLHVLVDPSHLKQIMDNLCHNALKYGRPERGPILLRVTESKQTVCIDVIDHGPVIAEDHLRHLFEPFFTTSLNGTGLGLYISRELAELNQAKLSYHVASDRQNCFRLCLVNAEHAIIEI